MGTTDSRFTSAIALLLVSLTPAISVAQPPAAPPVVAAGTPEAPIVLDGALDEPAWQRAGLLAELTQQDPEPGNPTPYSTRIAVLADSDTLYVGVTAVDPEPAKIAVHTLQRDSDMAGDDTVALVLDTFGDGRTGYLFRVNAGGARQDGLISGAQEIALDWDGIWDARVRRSAAGWTAEIAIPARGLRFRPGLDRWGFNVERFVARDRLTLRWAGATLDAALSDLERTGGLEGVSGLHQGLGLSFAPYALGRVDDERMAPRREKGEAGFDLSYNLTSGLGMVLTANTDFAETEVDARQINLTRFSLFFPEKRPFFLEGSNLFEFSYGLSDSFIPFYSRRMGLVRGRAVPIDGGLKVLGRAGPWAIAALDVQTGDDRAAPAENLFAGRVTYDVDEHLRVGGLATRGDPTGAKDNAFGGLDAVWRTASFHGDKNLVFAAWGAQSSGDLPAGSKTGWGLTAAYPNDLWDLSLSVNQFGEALDPALGFLPRPGVRRYDGGIAYQPRPREEGPFGWVRQFFFELYPSRVDRLDGTTESWEVFMAPFNVRTRSGEHLEVNWAPQFERLDEPFEVAEGVVLPPGTYQFNRFRLEAQSSEARPWSLGSTVWFGEFFAGHLTQWESFVNWTAGPGRLRFELSAENDFGYLPQGDFIQRLQQLKTLYAFSPDLLLSAFVQYDSDSRSLGLNSRLRWTIRPGSDLFVVWNRSWRRLPRPSTRFESDADQVAVKLRWTWLW